MDFKSLMPFSASRTSPASGTPNDPFSAVRRDMDRFFESFMRDGGFSGWPAAFQGSGFLTPKVNVAESASGLEVTAELPGIDMKDIHVELDQGVLSIKAEHRIEKVEDDEAKHYHLVERSSGTFLRRLVVPFEPDAERVEASFDNGVLKIVVPRSAAATAQVRKIAIKPAV